MNKKCTTCNYHGKTALCPIYDHRVAVKSKVEVSKAAKGHCDTWSLKKDLVPRLQK